MLNLTRPNILFDDIDRDYFGEEWFRIRAPHDTDNLIPYNQKVVVDFASNHLANFSTSTGHNERTDLQKHLVIEIPLAECMKQLLNKLKFTRESDSQAYSSLRGIINGYIEDVITSYSIHYTKLYEYIKRGY